MPDTQILNILKIDEKILKNIFRLSFRDRKIEEEYLNYYMTLNKILRYFIHFCYVINFIHKIIKGIFSHISFILIFQIIITIIYLLVCLGFYMTKNPKHKKFFDISAASINYIYQVLYITCLIYYNNIMDLHFRTKALFLLTSLSGFEILFSSESGLIIPIFMLIINISLNLIIYFQFEQIKENLMMIFSTLFIIITLTGYKRKIDELNRISFIEQYIFKKNYLYYYDFINNFNGFHFSLRGDSLIKINNNLNITLIAIKNQSPDKSINIDENKHQLGNILTENKLIKEENTKMKPSNNKINNFEVNTNTNDINKDFDYSKKILSFEYNKSTLLSNKMYKHESLDDKIQIFMKSLILKNINDLKFIDFNLQNKKIFDLYEIYNFIKDKEFNNQFQSENPVKEKEIIEILKEFKKNSLKNDEENSIIKKIINFESNPITFNKFILIGEFESSINKKIFQVFYRKLKEYNNFFDFSLYDITDIKEAERVTAENEIKNKFFAKVAHEFKTPIFSIVGLIRNIKTKLEIISEKSNTINIDCMYSFHEKSDFLSVLDQAESLSNYTIFLVHDLIDYSRLNKKMDYKIKLEKINILEIINFCNNILKSLLITKEKNKFINIEIYNDPLIMDEINLTIYSDTFRLKQILLNFISNSVKFTKTGFIKLKTEIKIQDKGERSYNQNIKRNNVTKNKNHILKISVIDSGIGLNEEEMKNIFDEDKNFNRKDYNKEGSGLGLSICKYLADILNHKLEVSSEFGLGTEFSIYLDCEFEPIVKKNFNFNTVINVSSNISCNNKEIKNCFNIFKNNDHNDKSNIDKNNNDNDDKKENNIDNIHFYKIIKKKNSRTNLKIETSHFQDISTYSNSSFETKIISDRKIQLENNIYSLIESEDNSILRLYLPEVKSKLKYEKNKINSSNVKKSSKFIYLYNKKDSNSKILLSKKNEQKIGTKDEEIDHHKINSKSFRNNKSDNFFMKKNFHTYIIQNKKRISGLNDDWFLNMKDKKISLCNKTLNSKKEDKFCKKKILIVDDHKFVRESIVFLVMKCIKNFKKENEFEIIEGKDGLDILNNLIEDQYDNNSIKCVITDENMEYINGSEAIEIIRKLEKHKKIKNVFIASITAFEDEFNKSKIYSSGADKIIPKPCSEKIMKDFLIENKIL